eukprot:TRINITY_DN7669_c0_g1_i1.p1 TRINITY_DN7669_c0_g1~~TRINITY_DN7669_c0_g1_i1.p1  ORF type:complete len:691 (+),score=215.91 TRINITY_DN7669_c0_g1_i1:66-2075(+)
MAAGEEESEEASPRGAAAPGAGADLPHCIPDWMRERFEAGGIRSLFPVQKTVLPYAMAAYEAGVSADVCVCSPTGSGKTLAYLLPIGISLSRRIVPRLRAIIVLPTKDLAQQVKSVALKFLGGPAMRIGAAHAGQSVATETVALSKRPPDILIATPGRLCEHLSCTPTVTLQWLRWLVLDEADMLLSDNSQDWVYRVLHGHAEAVRRIARPPQLHKMLFSATLTHNLAKLGQVQLTCPKHFELQESGAMEGLKRYSLPASLKEIAVVVPPDQKPCALAALLMDPSRKGVALVFTRTTEKAHRVARLMQLAGVPGVREFSAALTSDERSQVVTALRNGDARAAVASDALARGIDIATAKLVVNYDAPQWLQSYVHRVGRTARAGQYGEAVTLVEDEQDLQDLEALRGKAATSRALTVDRRAPKGAYVIRSALRALRRVLSDEANGTLLPTQVLAESYVRSVERGGFGGKDGWGEGTDIFGWGAERPAPQRPPPAAPQSDGLGGDEDSRLRFAPSVLPIAPEPAAGGRRNESDAESLGLSDPGGGGGGADDEALSLSSGGEGSLSLLGKGSDGELSLLSGGASDGALSLLGDSDGALSMLSADGALSMLSADEGPPAAPAPPPAEADQPRKRAREAAAQRAGNSRPLPAAPAAPPAGPAAPARKKKRKGAT